MNSDHFDRSPSALGLLLGSALALATFVGCGGGSLSAGAKASASASTDGEADVEGSAEGEAAWDRVDESQTEAETSANATPTQPTAPQTKTEIALLGARHDLVLDQGAPTPCACLAVVLGSPASPGIVWTGRRPTIDPTSQLVIALSSDGVTCSKSASEASYMGYEKKDGNVIVTVEAAVAGRPVTHGAIIPRPEQGGQVYVQPSGSVPYGRGKAGEARCTLSAAQ